MTVYVDNMRAQLGRMILCHMIADTEAELHAMASRIGMLRRWYQGDHYDVSASRRALAVKAGAITITWRQAAAMRARRKVTGELGKPEEAFAWYKAHQAHQAIEQGGGRAA
ncbi:DUF4031 domain-containing protein [Nitrospirillum iridis]|uniref:DUF4031 domain-containing protein n=1 Tax=Nitrospirillum iridis TaxID=765888 RepID=A0A7X0EC68_9PROT|nr:DUF4031 domain-containing protein [Nitrospirillum iridis]MBB6251397.1 hypothetical protein [Nitrospirillum iridis]